MANSTDVHCLALDRALNATASGLPDNENMLINFGAGVGLAVVLFAFLFCCASQRKLQRQPGRRGTLAGSLCR